MKAPHVNDDAPIRPHRRRQVQWLATASVVGLTLLGAACGSSDTNTSDSAAKRLAVRAGCAGCHGADFSGGVGPSWRGLYLSKVELADGTTVVADRTYLEESITNPGAKRVKGYTVAMPENRLTPEEVAQLVDLIIQLG